MKHPDNVSTQVWLLVVLAVGFVVCEISTTVSNNSGVDAEQLLNVSCEADTDCLRVHFAAVCQVTEVVNDSSGVHVQRECACNTEQRFYRRGDSCVYHSPVLGGCDMAGVASICEDPLSYCRLSSDGTGFMNCECQPGTVLVQDGSTNKCAYKLTTRNDSACDLCTYNNGVCFDLDNDGRRDGCACPPAYSGENCSVENVKVSCSAREMQICYLPHSDIDRTLGFSMYTDGRSHIASCRARLSESVCGEGQYLLNLPLHEALLSVCGTTISRGSGVIRYISRLVIQTRPEPAPFADRLLTAFCSFTRMQDISSVGLSVNSYSDTAVGQDILPLLSLSVKDTLGETLDPQVAARVGDNVLLHVYLSTANGYRSVRVETCTLSSSAVIPDSSAETLLVIQHGCPVPGQTFITDQNMFGLVQDQPNELQTGLVQLRSLRAGSSLHLHCTLKLCVQGYPEGCVLESCEASGRRRRRRAVEAEEDIAMVNIHKEVKLTDNLYLTNELGFSLSTLALAVLVVVLVSMLVVVGAVHLRSVADRRKRHKVPRVKLVQTRGALIDMLHRRGIPSHMTESEV